MKKNFLLLIVLFVFYSVNAQNETDPYQKNNEIKLNALAPLWQSFQVGYERHLNHHSSLGLSFYYVYDNKKNEIDLNYSISPYYRRYFGKKYASGWFVEGFGMLASTDGKKYTLQKIIQYIPRIPTLLILLSVPAEAGNGSVKADFFLKQMLVMALY